MRRLLLLGLLLLIAATGYHLLKEKEVQAPPVPLPTPESTPTPTPTPEIPSAPPAESKPPTKAQGANTLSDKEIAQVIQAQMSNLSRCYGRYARKNPDARGRLKTSIAIKPDGSVSRASIINSPDAELENCILQILKALHFKKFAGTPININYPMNFE
jgi:outer membrane biosynthesis protein TonB